MSVLPPEFVGETSATGDPRIPIAFPRLTEAQIAALEPFGKRIHVPKGENVFTVGESNLCMNVVASGEMTVVDGRTGQYVASHKPGGFSGDIDILSGRPVLVTGVAGTDLDLLQIPGECVRSIVGELPEVGEIILRAFLTRRALLQEKENVGPLVIGSRFSADTLRIREFLARNRYPHQFQDLETNPDTARILDEFQMTEAETPVVVCPAGEVLRVPSNPELAEALGIMRIVEDKLFDLVVVGAGPAGLAAAVYGASEGLGTLVIDCEGSGGQAASSSRIENYLGFPSGISGRDLADHAVIQAERFGAQIIVSRRVADMKCTGLGGHEIDLDEGTHIQSKCVLLAPGAKYRILDADPDQRYVGRGVYYAATNIERLQCDDNEVGVVGAGNSAGQAAVYMAENSPRVYLVVRGNDLRKSMSSYLAARIERSPKIKLLLDSEVTELHGEDCLESATITNRRTGEVLTPPIRGLFVMIGATPNTDWIPAAVARDAKGFVLTGANMARQGIWKYERAPFFLETSCPGVFAAGDARADSVKRVASAVGEGSMAIAFVHQFIAL